MELPLDPGKLMRELNILFERGPSGLPVDWFKRGFPDVVSYDCSEVGRICDDDIGGGKKIESPLLRGPNC